MTARKNTEEALFTDLYELTMAQSYYQEGMDALATFSLFTRKLPANRGYLVCAGLEDTLHYLEELRFSPEAVDYLHNTGLFAADFLSFLERLRFTGEVHAIPEGRLYFCDEPVLEVTAPITEAQIVETFILNQNQLPEHHRHQGGPLRLGSPREKPGGLLPTPYSRHRCWDEGGPLQLYGGLLSHQQRLGGENLWHPYFWGPWPTPTYPASSTKSTPSGPSPRSFPDHTSLLIDTFDVPAGAHKAAAVAKEMERRGHRLQAVRLDSGDLAALSSRVRQAPGPGRAGLRPGFRQRGAGRV